MKLPIIDKPMTYYEIRARIGIREMNRLKVAPYDLAIELAKECLAGRLRCRAESYQSRWPLYQPVGCTIKRVQPLRSGCVG